MTDTQTTSQPIAPKLTAADIDTAQIVAESTVKPGSVVHLHKQFNADMKDKGFTKETGEAALEELKAQLFEQMDMLYATGGRSVLVVLQGIDAAGKDGIVKHVMEGVNPEEVDVYGFKEPSKTEMAHDYLWRHEKAVPELGKMAIFNRSHYENVLVTRVHPDLLWPKTSMPAPEHIWKQRYKDINDWEKRLNNNGTIIIKLFLHVSRAEQGARFLSRIEDPSKNWKVSPTDMVERGFWDEYTTAFTDMLNHTSTDYAPWYALSMDHKWSGHLTAVSIILDHLKQLNLSYPKVDAAMVAELQKMKKELEEGK